MAKLLSYEEKGTWMEQLCGVTKMIFFLAWTIKIGRASCRERV